MRRTRVTPACPDLLSSRNCSYVYHLEKRVAYLEHKLQQPGFCNLDQQRAQNTVPESSAADPWIAPPLFTYQTTDESPASSISDSGQVAEAQTTLNELFRMMQRAPAHEPKICQVLLSALMKPSLISSVAKSTEQQPPQEGNQLLLSVTKGLGLPINSLPDSKAAEYLIRAYFEYANFCSPLLHEPTFRERLKRVYTEQEHRDTPAEHTECNWDLDVFFVNMVFAIGLLILQKRDSSAVPTLLCERYCETALAVLNKKGFSDNVEGVQALLLLAEYSYFHPTDHGGWDAVGLALRRAVELGLHEDPPDRFVDCLTLDIMRRTFWVAYSLDRNIAIATGRPTYLSDGLITAQVS